ncbi:pentatricopeptide repeat-containing protein At1g05750, chloroplastic-like [Phragmites australis]|uniref:pentatricopeptide repeat-containing protein At1g05750, chloroplastic-like n=1 Tax=Phragmites australis TaxID=29695 RepID=UPI002D780EE1|nr:pentatricopeptide repeat-containing protein At1g05750, chloroplastic-like [Phragmites australis]XP_062215794.1 pentatricopeptide repeat-containing protein At1g05750, chloroplastic-like [Phragmites australis]
MLTVSLLDEHLSRCRSARHLLQIHAQFLASGLLVDAFAASRLLLFTTSAAAARLLPCPLHHSLRLLRLVRSPNAFACNTLLRAAVRHGQPHLCLSLYASMPAAPDAYTHPLLAAACAARGDAGEGQQVHCRAVRHGFGDNVYLRNALMHMYSACGRVADARRVFDAGPVWDAVSWNTILAAYVRDGDIEHAVIVFESMPERSSAAVSSMVALFGRRGMVDEARRVFNGAERRDAFTWTAMISCFERNGLFLEALGVFSDMRVEGWPVDEAVMVSVVAACTGSEVIQNGEVCHGLVVRGGLGSRVNVQNALIHMYSSCLNVIAARRLFNSGKCLDHFSWNSMIAGYLKNGHVEDAKALFDAMPDKDNVSWSTMISGCVQNNQSSEALTVFDNMRTHGIKPDEVTLVSVISACTNISALEKGKSVHEYIRQHQYNINIVLGTSLIDMYMKCGCLETALKVFNTVEEKGTPCWNAVIVGLAMNGLVTKSLDMFSEMEASGTAVPNEITFTGVLSACRHAGLVEEGRHFFKLMQNKYQIVPNIRHYGCMVDLLGRAGYVREAEDLIESMPMSPDVPAWGALLGACWKHGDSEVGERVGRKLVELDPHHDGFQTMLSNIYASEGMWQCVKDLRGSMKQQHVSKVSGYSVVELSHSS